MNLEDRTGIMLLADAKCREWEARRRDAVIGKTQVVEIKTEAPTQPRKTILRSVLKSFLEIVSEHMEHLPPYRG